MPRTRPQHNQENQDQSQARVLKHLGREEASTGGDLAMMKSGIHG